MEYTVEFVNAHYATVSKPAMQAAEPSPTPTAQTTTSRNARYAPYTVIRHTAKASSGTETGDVYLKCIPGQTFAGAFDNHPTTYREHESMYAVFGPLNEHEFSSNVWFRKPRLSDTALLPDGREAMRRITRTYYEDTCTIFYDERTLSTRHFDNCSEFNTKLIVRTEEDRATVKLRVHRSKYNWRDKTTLALTRSLELPLPVVVYPGGTTRATKVRHMVFWGVTVSLNDRAYLFRVAFRTDSRRSHVECNIECEDPIDGDLFGRIFYTLYKYYKHQYETQERLIEPIVGDHAQFQQSVSYQIDLTEEQRRIIDTMRLVAWPDDGGTAAASEDAGPVGEFVTYLGLCSYADVAADGRPVNFGQTFRHLKIQQTDDVCASFDEVF